MKLLYAKLLVLQMQRYVAILHLLNSPQVTSNKILASICDAGRRLAIYTFIKQSRNDAVQHFPGGKV